MYFPVDTHAAVNSFVISFVSEAITEDPRHSVVSRQSIWFTSKAFLFTARIKVNTRSYFTESYHSKSMTGFPISYPKVDGPGRLLELCSFHRSKITEERVSDELPTLFIILIVWEKYDKVFNEISEITSKFPISRQSLTGKKQSTEQLMTVLIADWTSAEEKDLFEPGMISYEGVNFSH